MAPEVSSSPSSHINVAHLLALYVQRARHACDIALASHSKSSPSRRGSIACQVILDGLRSDYPRLVVVTQDDHIGPLAHNTQRPSYGIVALAEYSHPHLTAPAELQRVPTDDVFVLLGSTESSGIDALSSDNDFLLHLAVIVRGIAVAGLLAGPRFTDHLVFGMVQSGTSLASRHPAPNIAPTPILSTTLHARDFVVRSVQDVVNAQHTTRCQTVTEAVLCAARQEAQICVIDSETVCLPASLVAAADVMITASGGTVTDLFGKPMTYSQTAPHWKRFGILASSEELSSPHGAGRRSHASVCVALRVSTQLDSVLSPTGLCGDGVPQASDIARDIDGNHVTAEWLSTILGVKVTNFSADESFAVRYLMSEACRLKITTSNEASSREGTPDPPKSLFLKRIIMRELKHAKLKLRTAPHKIARDIRSYQVELRFLSSTACREFSAVGPAMSHPVYAESRLASKDAPLLENRFFWLLRDFSPDDGWYQTGLLDKEAMFCTLDALACLHAYFWNFQSDPRCEELSQSVWEQATHWLPSRQAADGFDRIGECWKEHCERFGEQWETLPIWKNSRVTIDSFGDVLGHFAPACATSVHNVGLQKSHPHRTLIHGDAKAGNLFFRKSPSETEFGKQTLKLEVGMIDFQWCGWGHPAVDVAYVFAAAAGPHVLHGNKTELQYLETYYARFVRHCVRFRKADCLDSAKAMMSFEDFLACYEDAIVDLARVVVSYHWDRIMASPEVLKSRCEMIASNAYNKDLKCANWLVSKTAMILAGKLEGSPGVKL